MKSISSSSVDGRAAMQKAEKRLYSILQKSANLNLTDADLAKLDVSVALLEPNRNKKRIRTFAILIIGIVLLLYVLATKVNIWNDSECLIDMPADVSKLLRDPEDCKICENTTHVPKVHNISASDFHTLYADQGKPVIVSDGATYWPASKLIDFNFFKDLHETVEPSTRSRRNCQFFPYKTEFHSLSDVFNMDPRRARLERGTKPWYIGWSNCNDRIGKVIRQYYDVPYFLGNTSENLALSWIFMGGPGDGAHMHVDNVQFPSWQAQLKGRKLWRLAPPPECFYKCQEMQVIVEPGEIIVLDTNRWYHQTKILPGDVSITIGSEFD